MKVSIDEATEIATSALKRAGAAKAMADATASGLVAAERDGLIVHGRSRVQVYCQHLREGRADGKATPKVVAKRGPTCLIDAHGGLASLAAALAAKEAVKRAQRQRIAFAGVTNSHHF